MGAFSKSIDNGMTWADISLMAYTLSDITDMYVAPNASQWYFGVINGTYGAVYRYNGSWQRVLNLPNQNAANPILLRAAPDSPDALYVAVKGTTAIYFTADSGQTRWFNRTGPGNIADLAAESADVVYVGYGTTLKKSTNQGFTWGGPVYPLNSGNIYSLYSVSANNLIVGSDAAGVSYSTDGGATFTKMVPTGFAATGNVMAIADNLAAGGHIYGATDTGYEVYRYVIGTDTSWRGLQAPNPAGTTTGLALAKGVLYASTTNTSYTIQRDTFPVVPTPTSRVWDLIPPTSGVTLVATRAPWAVKTSTGSVKLWVANVAAAADTIYSYLDTLADTTPTVSAPADAAVIPLNPQSGYAYSVTFTWTRPSLATGYEIWIALDKAFTQIFQVIPDTTIGTPNTFDTISYVLSGGSLTPGTTYYWAVKAKDPISSPLSQMRSFVLQPMAAQVPVIGVPTNGATLTTTSPVFSWSPVSGTTSYDFQLSELPGFETTVFTDKTSHAAEALPVTIKLSAGKTYFWRVRASAPVQGDWSVVGTFTIAPPPTSTSTPPPITITSVPPPTITLPTPTSTIITIPPPPPAQTDRSGLHLGDHRHRRGTGDCGNCPHRQDETLRLRMT